MEDAFEIKKNMLMNILKAMMELIREQEFAKEGITASVLAGLFMSTMDSVAVLYTNTVCHFCTWEHKSIEDTKRILNKLDLEKEKEIMEYLDGKHDKQEFVSIFGKMVNSETVLSPKWYDKASVERYHKKLENIISDSVKGFGDSNIKEVTDEPIYFILRSVRDALFMPVVFTIGALKEYFNIDKGKTIEMLSEFKKDNADLINSTYPEMLKRNKAVKEFEISKTLGQA